MLNRDPRVRREKLVLLGPPGSGKTCITNRIIHGLFRENSSPTVGGSAAATHLNIDGIEIRLDIWDTGGSERFRALAPMYYRDARAAIVVFDLTDPASLVSAHEWISEVREKGRKDIVIVAAGNKVDLERAIKPGTIETFHFENQLEDCIEVSAKTGQNIDKLFETVCDCVLKLPPLEGVEGELSARESVGTTDSSGCSC
jgi:small GTP-binding protein